MTYSAVRRLQFCSGHRVYKHESKCNNLHGHNYVLFIHARAKDDDLDSIGRVIDFSVLKSLMGNWIDENWDHGFIYYALDSEVEKVLFLKKYAMPNNPTAENMAHYLLNVIAPTLFKDTGVEIYKIVLWETENCFAEVTLDV